MNYWIENLPTINNWKKYSQYGEESYLKYIFDNIGETNRYYVDFGAGDGVLYSNTLYFKELGWNGLSMDGDNKGNEEVKKEWITRENIIDLFEKYNVPKSFDLLSIDTDGNDYWILEKILQNYSPRVVIAEFNCKFTEDKSITIKYNPNHVWNSDDYFGFSFSAGKKLANKMGYELIWQNENVNLYFIKKDLIKNVKIPEVNYQAIAWFKESNRTDWEDV